MDKKFMPSLKKNKQTTQIFSNHAQLKRQRQPPLPLDAVVTSQI